MHKLRFALLLAALGGTMITGCQSIATPTLYPPGTVQQQQFNAQRFDPFPEPDTAPEIVGARGREYSKPVAEPSRARWNPTTWFSGWHR